MKKLDRDGLQHIEHVPEQWLVHFSGYAEDISRDGFIKGTPLNHKGWKGTFGSSFNAPGFNFACAAHDEQALEFWSQYCSCAVVFRAEGVTCWHKDGFDQVIFWGPSAKRPIYLIEAEYGPTAYPADDGEWTVKMKDGSPIDPADHGTGDMWTVLRAICGPINFS